MLQLHPSMNWSKPYKPVADSLSHNDLSIIKPSSGYANYWQWTIYYTINIYDYHFTWINWHHSINPLWTYPATASTSHANIFATNSVWTTGA